MSEEELIAAAIKASLADVKEKQTKQEISLPFEN